MTERCETYDVSEAPRIEISSAAGDVLIKQWDENRVKVVLSGQPEAVEKAIIEASHDTVSIRSRSDSRGRRFFARAMDVTVTAPPGGTIHVRSGSGDVRVRLRASGVDINAASGDVRIEEDVDDVRVKVASGGVSIAHVNGDVEVVSASGEVEVEHAADVHVSSASGSIIVGTVERTARLKSASGDVKVRDFRGSDLVVKTMSGDAILGLAPGRVVEARVKTLSGDFRNRIEPSCGDKTGRMTLVVTSFSGDVILLSAR